MRGPPVAGPSRRTPMERLGEVRETEEEEEEEIEALPDQRETGYNAGVREREIATQKARIVSQMANIPKPSALSPRRTVPAQPPPADRKVPSNGLKTYQPVLSKPPPAPSKVKESLFDIFGNNLTRALSKAMTREGFHAPREYNALWTDDAIADAVDIPLDPDPPKVFVVSWLDYCNKYGMGFAMSDGTVSVHFNDTSSLVLAPGKT